MHRELDERTIRQSGVGKTGGGRKPRVSFGWVVMTNVTGPAREEATPLLPARARRCGSELRYDRR